MSGGGRAAILAAVLTVILAATACGAPTTEPVHPSNPNPSTGQTGEVASPTTVNPLPVCMTAPIDLVSEINAAFTGDQQLQNARAVTEPEDLVYISGFIAVGGEMISGADVWVARHGTIYAMSEGARRHTRLPDGREITPVADQYGAAAQECAAGPMKFGSQRDSR